MLPIKTLLGMLDFLGLYLASKGHDLLSNSRICVQSLIPEWNQLVATGLGQLTIIVMGISVVGTTC